MEWKSEISEEQRGGMRIAKYKNELDFYFYDFIFHMTARPET